MSLLLTLDYKLFRTQSGKAWLSVKGMNAKVTNEFVSPAWTGSRRYMGTSVHFPSGVRTDLPTALRGRVSWETHSRS